jgi:beta-galactosidase
MTIMIISNTHAYIRHPLKILFLIILLIPGQTKAQRFSELINWGWKFHAGDIKNGASKDIDDTTWKEVDLPHDFQIEQPWIAPSPDEQGSNADEGANIKSRLSSRGFKEMGIGWYRKHFMPNDSLKAKRIILDIEGIMLVGDVYLNGELIGSTDYGYLGFDIDISKRIKYGEDNVIAVRSDTRLPENSRWYTGGGLFRDVHLIYTDPKMYFTRHPIQISCNVTNIEEDKGDADIQIQAETFTQLDSRTSNIKFKYTIFDSNGSIVADNIISKKFYPKQKQNEYILDTLHLKDVKLWSCENPYLYTLEVRLLDGNERTFDVVKEQFGIRKIDFSPEYGMRLNGKKVLLKGIANHHTLGALGAAAYERAIEKRILLLKDFGFNHIRTSHNPYSESLLKLCDKHGILVVDELYDKWLDKYCGGRKPWTELWQKNIPEFIKRDRNHPCVIMWSLGNELQTYWDLPYADWGVTPYRMQKQLLRRYDKERPITVAMHPRGRNVDTDSLPAPLVHETDIAAYNYRYMYFPGDGKRFPNLIFYQSEANTSMMGLNFFEMNLDKVVGLAYWGMIDYLGESNGWPEKGWSQGVFDISLEPKPNAYFIKSYFSDYPMVHIGVYQKSHTFDWNGIKVGGDRLTENWNLATETDKHPQTTILTYTNADEVELLLNGKSIGIQKNDVNNPKSRNKITWKNVRWEPGKLEAIARSNGKEVARHKLESNSKATQLELIADNDSWKSDGLDLQHVRVHAVDKKGRRDYNCDKKLKFEVFGNASIVAVSSGDHRSDELNVTDTRSLYDGSALVILRSTNSSGPITLKVTADGLKPAILQLKTNE